MHVEVINYLVITAIIFLAMYPLASECRGRRKHIGRGHRKHLPDGYISRKELSWLAIDVNRNELQLKLDQVRTKRPDYIPQCTYKGYIYDPQASKCGERCEKAHCGENMLLIPNAAGYGGCTCSSTCDLDCFGRPLWLASDKCYKIATQGPCPEGEVLVPVDRTSLKCGPDACLYEEPRNAIQFSALLSSYEGSKEDVEEVVFKFTYKDKCYMTETEAFCGPGKVVRFLLPYKNPFCVPRDHVDCALGTRSKTINTGPIRIPCGPSHVEDKLRNVCINKSKRTYKKLAYFVGDEPRETKLT